MNQSNFSIEIIVIIEISPVFKLSGLIVMRHIPVDLRGSSHICCYLFVYIWKWFVSFFVKSRLLFKKKPIIDVWHYFNYRG